MGLTELGFERPTYDDLLEAQIQRAKMLFGDDIDTSDSTPLGKYMRLNVTDLADCYEVLEGVYYSRFPNTARGISLDRLCPFAGITRNPATYATHKVVFTGEAGEKVPEAFEVSAGDIVFHTYDELIIGEDGTVEGTVECDFAGTIGNVNVGAINNIVNPDANVESVTNTEILVYGIDMESDTELRDRFNMSMAGAGGGTALSISGAILRVPLIDGVDVVENKTDQTVDGIPPHSFECFVLGPESQDELVAQAIFDRKPLGIKSHGDVEVEIYDTGGTPHNVYFSRTEKVDIYIKFNILTNNFFPLDGVNDIKNNITNYINTLKNGEEVYLSSIYGHIYDVEGVVNVTNLVMSTDGEEYSTSDITINSKQIARTTVNNLEVVVLDE